MKSAAPRYARRHVPRIAAVGDLTADLIVEVQELPIRAGDFHLAEEVLVEPGGSANLLILLSRLGDVAVALGALGTDLWGSRIYEILQAEGVGVSSIRRDGTTTAALVLVGSPGDHAFVGCYGKGDPLTLGEQEQRVLDGAEALFTSGYSLGEARLMSLTLEALEYAGQRGIPRFFDPGPSFKSLEPAVQRRVLASCEFLLLTEEELGYLPHAAPASSRAAVGRSGAYTTVVKLGARGCRVAGADGEQTVVPAPPVTERDTTAAGDCFDAAFIWAYLDGRSLEDCARLANYAGAAAVQKLGGGRNVPTLEELREMIAHSGGEPAF
jgi:sugar/nucleoside kinase (ribokinase family)